MAKSRRRLLIFYPHNPFIPEHGSHLRCLQQIDDLTSEYSIVVASSLATSDSKWPRSRENLRQVERERKIEHISIFEYSYWGHACHLSILAVGPLLKPFTSRFRGKSIEALRKLFYLAWFSCLAFKHKPKCVIIHYTYWSYFTKCVAGKIRVIELHDLLPVNQYLSRSVVESLQRIKTDKSPSDQANIVYIDNVEQLPRTVVEEVKNISLILNQYDLVWMISEREKSLLRELGLKAASHVIYPATRPAPIFCEKDLPPILPVGPNPFNTYGLTRFISDVIPLLDYKLVQDTQIHVTGSFWREPLDLPAPLHYLGTVDDYVNRLARSTFMVAPTCVGTGQQIKIFEALGSATPVITYRAAVPGDIIRDYPSIIAVDTPREFANMINNLLNDVGLLQHFWRLAQNGAKRQEAYRAQHPYCLSLNDALSRSSSSPQI
jgi:glycosyltransferase involved in cell wall biosynthesis